MSASALIALAVALSEPRFELQELLRVSITPPAPPSGAVITSEPGKANYVSVTGAGKLKFDSDLAFPPAPGPVPESWLRARYSVDRSGKILSCTVLDSDGDDKFSKGFCGIFAKTAVFSFDADFRLPVDVGSSEIQATKTHRIFLQTPFKFLPNNQGHEVVITIEPVLDGEPLCSVWTGSGRIAFSDIQTVCKTFKSSKFFVARRRENEPYQVKTWIESRRIDPRKQRVFWYESLEMARPLFEYPRFVSDDLVIPSSEGRFSVSLNDDDYPAGAIEYGLDGITTVDIGINPQGKVQSCVPVSSAGWAVLDVRACNVMRVKGQYQFNQPNQGWTGIRYVRTRVRWQIPDSN